jgi:hypothetical protein
MGLVAGAHLRPLVVAAAQRPGLLDSVLGGRAGFSALFGFGLEVRGLVCLLRVAAHAHEPARGTRILPGGSFTAFGTAPRGRQTFTTALKSPKILYLQAAD